MSLALWLRTGRTERGLSLVDVARITKIQTRILERLEAGKLDGLPAEVFVRGFIRSYAKCCGLDEAEALTRFSAASQAQLTATAPATPSTLAAPPAARAMVDAMSDLAPRVSRNTPPVAFAALVPATAIEVVDHSGRSDLAAGSLAMPAIEAVEAAPVAEEAAPTTAKKKRRGGKRAKRKSMATGTPSVPTPVVVERVSLETLEAMPAVEAIEAAPVVEAAPIVEDVPVVVDQLDPLVEPPSDAHEDIVATPVWQPKMPPVTTTASVPWRRPGLLSSAATASSVPTLVIDDADPDSAEQVLEDRAEAKSVLTNAQRRSFLPPILLDREDRSARQGGLTLAVIILLIAATLTLSYLMRRPSSSGDGVTAVDVETQLIG